MPRSRFLDVAIWPVIDDHPFDAPDWRLAVAVVRRPGSGLAPAALQHGLCRGHPRSGRCVGIVHDFGQHRDRVLGVFARQLAYVFRLMRFIAHHGGE